MEAFDYDALAAYNTIVISYNGEGDEGFIEEIEIVDPVPPEGMLIDLDYELERSLKDSAYDLLAAHHGGWEINEGSSGTITIDVKARKATLKHGANRIEQDWTTTEV